MKPVQLFLTAEVVDAIDKEFEYQHRVSGTDRADDVDAGVAGQLVSLDTYTRKAIDAWTLNRGDEEALDNLRKVAAVALRALLLYGCPKREIPESTPTRRPSAECEFDDRPSRGFNGHP